MIEDLSTKIFYVLDQISNCITETDLGNINSSEQPDQMYSIIIQKIISHLDATAHTFLFANHRPNLYESLYIIHRTALLDVIDLYYILLAKDNNEELQKRVKALQYDHIGIMYRNADNENEKIKIRADFAHCFQGIKFIGNRLSVYDNVKAINVPPFNKEIAQAYYWYRIFSKMEHNGYFTNYMMQLVEHETGLAQPASLIFRSIRILLLCVFTTLENTILQGNSDIKSEIDSTIGTIFQSTHSIIEYHRSKTQIVY